MQNVKDSKDLVIISKDDIADLEKKAYEKGYADGKAEKSTAKKISKAKIRFDSNELEFRANEEA